MTREEIEQKTSLCFLLNPNISEEEKICVIEKVMATKATIVSKAALCNIITYILKENAELKSIKDIATLISANNDTVITLMQLNNMLVSKNQRLIKAKELLTKWVELFKPKGGNIPPTPIQVETEEFISEVEK